MAVTTRDVDLAKKVPVVESDDEAIEVARTFALKLADGAVARDREGSFPADELRDLAASGLLGITVPRRYGGADVSQATLIEVIRILACADPSIAQLPQSHFGALEEHRLGGAAGPLAEFLFAEALRGARIGNAIAERGTKTAAVFATRIDADGPSAFRVNGRKYYATGARDADWITVLGNINGDALGSALVAGGAEGVEIVDDWSSFGQRSTASGSVILADVSVPASLVIEFKAGGPSILGAANQSRHAAIDTGIARAALEDGVAFVRDRARPWADAGVERAADEPHTLLRFGQMTTRLHAVEALLTRAGGLLDDAARLQPLTAEAAGAASLAVAEVKAFSAEIALEIATSVLELGGSSATDSALALDRHWRNARTHTLHDPARWKYHHIGNHTLNGVLPPKSHLL